MTKIECFESLKKCVNDNPELVAFMDYQIDREKNWKTWVNNIEENCKNTVATFVYTDPIDRHEMNIIIDFIHPSKNNTYFTTLTDRTAHQYCSSEWLSISNIKKIIFNYNCEKA